MADGWAWEDDHFGCECGCTEYDTQCVIQASVITPAQPASSLVTPAQHSPDPATFFGEPPTINNQSTVRSVQLPHYSRCNWNFDDHSVLMNILIHLDIFGGKTLRFTEGENPLLDKDLARLVAEVHATGSDTLQFIRRNRSRDLSMFMATSSGLQKKSLQTIGGTVLAMPFIARIYGSNVRTGPKEKSMKELFLGRLMLDETQCLAALGIEEERIKQLHKEGVIDLKQTTDDWNHQRQKEDPSHWQSVSFIDLDKPSKRLTKQLVVAYDGERFTYPARGSMGIKNSSLPVFMRHDNSWMVRSDLFDEGRLQFHNPNSGSLSSSFANTAVLTVLCEDYGRDHMFCNRIVRNGSRCCRQLVKSRGAQKQVMRARPDIQFEDDGEQTDEEYDQKPNNEMNTGFGDWTTAQQILWLAAHTFCVPALSPDTSSGHEFVIFKSFGVFKEVLLVKTKAANPPVCSVKDLTCALTSLPNAFVVGKSDHGNLAPLLAESWSPLTQIIKTPLELGI